MGKRVVGYVISHSGKPGGPWECEVGPFGHSTDVPAQRMVWGKFSRYVAQAVVDHIRWLHPAARILRLVRRDRDRHRAEEREVIRLAMAYFLTNDMSNGVEFSDVLIACAALRAKRGSK